MLKIVKPRKTKLIRWTFHIFALIRFQGTELRKQASSSVSGHSYSKYRKAGLHH